MFLEKKFNLGILSLRFLKIFVGFNLLLFVLLLVLACFRDHYLFEYLLNLIFLVMFVIGGCAYRKYLIVDVIKSEQYRYLKKYCKTKFSIIGTFILLIGVVLNLYFYFLIVKLYEIYVYEIYSILFLIFFLFIKFAYLFLYDWYLGGLTCENFNAVGLFDSKIKMDKKSIKSFPTKNSVKLFKKMVVEILSYVDVDDKDKPHYEKYCFCASFKDYDVVLNDEIMDLLKVELKRIKQTLESGLDYVIKPNNLLLEVYDILIDHEEEQLFIAEQKEKFDILKEKIQDKFNQYQNLLNKNIAYIKEHEPIKLIEFEFTVSESDIESHFDKLFSEMKAHRTQIKNEINLLSKQIQAEIDKIK